MNRKNVFCGDFVRPVCVCVFFIVIPVWYSQYVKQRTRNASVSVSLYVCAPHSTANDWSNETFIFLLLFDLAILCCCCCCCHFLALFFICIWIYLTISMLFFRSSSLLIHMLGVKMKYPGQIMWINRTRIDCSRIQRVCEHVDFDMKNAVMIFS